MLLQYVIWTKLSCKESNIEHPIDFLQISNVAVCETVKEPFIEYSWYWAMSESPWKIHILTDWPTTTYQPIYVNL